MVEYIEAHRLKNMGRNSIGNWYILYEDIPLRVINITFSPIDRRIFFDIAESGQYNKVFRIMKEYNAQVSCIHISNIEKYKNEFPEYFI